MRTNRHTEESHIRGVPRHKPPSPRLRRTLSLPSPSPHHRYRHPQSPLLALPAGLREQILAYLLRAVHLPLKACNRKADLGRLCIDHAELDIALGVRSRPIFPLLISCRQVYVEAIHLVYSSCTVHTDDPSVITRLPAAFPPQRFKGMHLDFTWILSAASPLGHYPRSRKKSSSWRRLDRGWGQVWSALADMKGLASLRVSVHVDPGRWSLWQHREKELFRTAEDAGPWNVGKFEIAKSWPRQTLGPPLNGK